MMYWALTTLSTVGYGEYYPCSTVEMILGSAIMMLGSILFSILMNNFIDVVLSIRGTSYNDNDDRL
jgi:voltage-gated potassium channel Kch